MLTNSKILISKLAGALKTYTFMTSVEETLVHSTILQEIHIANCSVSWEAAERIARHSEGPIILGGTARLLNSSKKSKTKRPSRDQVLS